MDSIDQQGLPVICGVCCAYTLLLSNLHSCLGCMGKCELLCCGASCCLKSGAESIKCEKDFDQICMMGCYVCEVSLQYPKTCIKSSCQCLCCIEQVAFPCDETMPCVVNVCCLNIYPKVGCHVVYGEIENTGVCRWLAPSFKVAASG
jgi:hypothetical protein